MASQFNISRGLAWSSQDPVGKGRVEAGRSKWLLWVNSWGTGARRLSPHITSLTATTPKQAMLSLAFLDYYQAQGGEEVFGYPITEPFWERGLIVQYFQRARMEWHPVKKCVQLGLLGEEYFEARGLDPALRTPVEPIVEETTPSPLFQGSERGCMWVRGTKGEGLQLREGPGSAFATVYLLPEGTLVKVTGGPVKGGWLPLVATNL